MALDTPTLFVTIIMVTFLVGALLLFSWSRNREVRALLWWSYGYLTCSAGVGLLALRGLVPDLLSIQIANAILITGIALLWAGARVFDGRRVEPAALLAGAAAWLVACEVAAIRDDINARVVIVSLVLAAYTLLAAYEILRHRGDGLTSRLPIGVVLLLHSCFILARLPMTLISPIEQDNAVLEGNWFAAVNLEAILYLVTLAFLILTMAKERVEMLHKSAALRDHLTGVANRRAFFAEAQQLIDRTTREGAPVAALVFDLDRFKDINDTFGHQVGDRVIRLFAEVARRELRAGDLFGRMGGEEFTALVPGARLMVAHAIAERIRTSFADAADTLDGMEVAARVSIGVAIAEDRHTVAADLLAAADRALYRSKSGGRDRVEVEEPRIGSLRPAM